MKKILQIITLLLLPMVSYSQLVDTQPDTVCFGSNQSIYEIDFNANYTYNWVVQNPGQITNAQPYSNSIIIDWSSANPGLIDSGVWIWVTDNLTGCSSDTVFLDIFIYRIIPEITIIGPFCEGDPCENLLATPNGGTFIGDGLSNNSQFCPDLSGVGLFDISYQIESSGCVFETNISVEVYSRPPIPVILHD